MTDAPTLGDMVTKYREIETMLSAAQAVFDAEWKPYQTALNALKTACGAELQRQNAQNFRNDAGMAYLKKGAKIEVDNPAEFLKFVVEQNKWEFLNPGVVKDPVEALVVDDAGNYTGEPPPGVKITPYVTCVIRK